MPCLTTASSVNPDMKSTRASGRNSRAFSASSRPLICGMTTSVMIKSIFFGEVTAHLQTFAAVRSRQDAIAVFFEKLFSECAHHRFIFNQKNRLVAVTDIHWRGVVLGFRNVIDPRQVNLNRGPVAGFAVDPNGP